MLDSVISEFISNTSYWKNFLPKNKNILFDSPDVVVRFVNTFSGNKLYYDVQIFDTKRNVPPTTTLIQPAKNSPSALEKNLPPGIPVIKLGHSNSFVKSISMTHIMDENMRAAFIEKMANARIASPRDKEVLGNENFKKASKPLKLPLQGEIEVLGHPDWEPFKFFFLNTGIYLIDGIYKILSTTDVLSHEGFKTKLEIIYH